VAAALDQRLPPETAIRLGPRLAGNDQWAQRMKEGLYPRRVRADAAITLELGGSPPIAQTPQGALSLQGKLPPAPKTPVLHPTDFDLSWGRVALHAFAAFGWGAALVLALRRLRRRELTMPLAAASGLAAPVVFAVLATAATLVQKPLPWGALTVIGVVLAAAALALSVDRARVGAQLRATVAWIRHAETWVVLAFSAVLVHHMAVWPIIGWDGRSIWLYRTKMLVFNGFLPAADAANLENYFSHMEYPLLFPAWLAQFASLGPLRERELGVAIILLQMGLLAALWWLARRRLGRWTGAAFTGAVYFLSAGMAERGYADGLVTMFLVCTMLGLDDEALEPFGWLAAMGTMLSKAEGLVCAVMAGGAFLLLHPHFRARGWRQRLLPALVLLPSLAQSAWTHAIGIKSQYAGAHLPTLHEALARTQTVWTGLAKIAREFAPVAHLPAILACFVVLEIAGRRSWLSRIGALTGVAFVLFSLGVMMVTPYDVAWHVDTAMGRLLLHSLFALVLAVLVALVPPPTAPSTLATAEP
jgi:hypothetical protein